MTDSQSPAQSTPKNLQIYLESVTPMHGHRHQPLYFVLLLENLTGQPSTSSLSMNPALASIMPGKGTSSGPGSSELSDWVNAFVSPVFILHKHDKKTFPGGFPLYFQPPTDVVSFYFAVMRSHGRERDLGKELSDVMGKISSSGSLSQDLGDLEQDRMKLRTAKKDETSPATTTQTTTSTTTGDTTVQTTTKPTTADDVAKAAENLVVPGAEVVQQAASAAFSSLGAALEDRGDRKVFTTMVTLRATDTPPYQAGTHNDWGDERIAISINIDY